MTIAKPVLHTLGCNKLHNILSGNAARFDYADRSPDKAFTSPVSNGGFFFRLSTAPPSG